MELEPYFGISINTAIFKLVDTISIINAMIYSLMVNDEALLSIIKWITFYEAYFLQLSIS